MLPPWNGFLPAFQQLECFPVEIAFYQHFSSWNAFPLKLFFTSLSVVRMLPLHIVFYTSISAVRMLPLKLLSKLERFPLEVAFASISAVRMLPSISAVRTLPPWNCFASISAVRMFPPWNGFLPAFHQLERFPLDVAFTQAFQQLECFPLEIALYQPFSS